MILILISEFMQDEIYLKHEINYYEKFDDVYFFSVKGHVYANSRLEFSDKITDGETDIFYSGLFSRVYHLFRGLFSFVAINELIRMIINGKLSLDSLKQFLLFTSKSDLIYRRVKKKLKEFDINHSEKVVFYSYRFGLGVFASIRLKRLFDNALVLSRGHGQDIFEFRNKEHYLPYRNYLYKNVDNLYLVSEDGYSYVTQKYPFIKGKSRVSYLGTPQNSVNSNLSYRNLHIVTVSRIVPIKRLHRIAEALNAPLNIDITWSHYGDGDESYLKKIEEILSRSSNKVSTRFYGFIDNRELRRILSTEAFTVFLNVSESEGLPVSIMEAEAVGLPIIATDVGGTSEAVINGMNGFLLKKDFSNSELISALSFFSTITEDEYKRFSLNSRKIWEDKFNLDKNYTEFVDSVLRL